MIKHLKPRSKWEIRIAKFKDFFTLNGAFFEVTWYWKRVSYLLNNRKWKHVYGFDHIEYKPEDHPEIWHATYPYTYVTSKKEIQETSATIYAVCKRQWIKKWRGIRVYNDRARKFIEIKFEPTIGEKTYDSGCYICDYEMLRGETPLNTLRRMEKERKF